MLWLKKKKGAKSHFECRPFKWYLGATASKRAAHQGAPMP